MNIQSPISFARSEKTNTSDYRLVDDCNNLSSTETALMIRPSFLQFVTDSVPAIDLDNRQHLMRSVLEIMKRMEESELDLLNNGARSARHAIAPMVSLINPISSTEVNNLRNLFHRPNSPTDELAHQKA